ncbi:MAG: class I SAM-dependent methyltransferase [Verrucomicrobiota bacterium]
MRQSLVDLDPVVPHIPGRITPKPKPGLSSPLRLRVTATAESILRRGHPWLYAESIREQNRPGEVGDLAAIYDRNDRFLAIGLFDPESPLRLRVLQVGKPTPINRTFWETRLRQALDRRRGLSDAGTTGYRCLHGESDGWPGLVLDRYAQTCVVKIYTAAWLPFLTEIASLFQAELSPERLVLRLSRNIHETACRRFQRHDGELLLGAPVTAPLVFQESGLSFEADVLKGQKTGFFLDQRENRRRLEELAAGRTMLNVFSFSGGFSLYAARGGAAAVTDVDISRHALNSAERNFALNASDRRVRACPHALIQADAFEWLAQGTSRYDLVVLDPPAFAKKKLERLGALEAYGRLVQAATGRLAEGGLLLAASCSAQVPAVEFFDTVRGAVRLSGRGFSERGTTRQPPDHPAGFPEAEYLKAIYLELDRAT